MSYSNKYLTEVNCGFLFPEETVTWDSTFFGQFYDRIKDQGFTSREERKGIQISFGNINVGAGLPQFSTSEAEGQVIFRNIEKGLAIVLGRQMVSFHCILNYPGWDNFLSNFIIPYSKLYLDLGLGNGKRLCSIVYLNRFNIPTSDNLSEYFTSINPINSSFGKEIFSSSQRVISNPKANLISNFNFQGVGEVSQIHFECGAVCNDIDSMMQKDWAIQASLTHDPILSFFESIITEKLKSQL